MKDDAEARAFTSGAMVSLADNGCMREYITDIRLLDDRGMGFLLVLPRHSVPSRRR